MQILQNFIQTHTKGILKTFLKTHFLLKYDKEIPQIALENVQTSRCSLNLSVGMTIHAATASEVAALGRVALSSRDEPDE